ncbi:hypothetical protein D3C77_533040 [compost metagenome]
MRPPKATPEIIIQAGESIQQDGGSVTAYSLRKKIGFGRGERLMEVWRAHSQSVQPGASASRSLACDQNLETDLETLRQQLATEKAMMAEKQLVLDVVTDQLRTAQATCAALEERCKQKDVRISDLIARIDEQRGELHRNSQYRSLVTQLVDNYLPGAELPSPPKG